MLSHLRLVTGLWLFFMMSSAASGQPIANSRYGQPDRFRQLDETLPTPGAYRTASGAPGHAYWQQKVDYEIDLRLDEKRRRIRGRETITYKNNSPDTLTYLWLQLDANRFHPDSKSNGHQTGTISERMQFKDLEAVVYARTFPGGVQLLEVTDAGNDSLPHHVVGTHLRVDMPEPLITGGSFRFRIVWKYNIPDATILRVRGGFEYFEEDGNYIFEIAQWFPRLCVYSDSVGWQHKEFLGRGEFALEFGDYLVKITVPDDHVVGATGQLVNPDEVLTEDQQSRLKQARTAKAPVFVITPEEAEANESEGSDESRTWIFSAKNVRDFAFASSRKFIWDAWGHEVDGRIVLAMSLYPREGEPLWSKYSTHAIVHTLDVYSKFAFPYPYPVAYSVNGPVYGMEYPMICFNGPRPEKDGTYSKKTKHRLISVIIHEVGHNWFPMVVNSDERQWTWMDEGLNTFLQYLAESEWQDVYPSRSGEPKDITAYMSGTEQVPIMTNSESILQFGPNAYSKPATALNVLRESVLGRELFDFAFREYSRRWMFRRPYPADFFRTMEDASGVDLDWFWRGWFYSTDHVDVAVTDVRVFSVDDGNPRKNSRHRKKERSEQSETLSRKRNKPLRKRIEEYPELADFYNEIDDLDVTEEEQQKFREMFSALEPKQKKLLRSRNDFYVVDLENRGGLVTPIVLKLTHSDRSSREERLPAEIWAKNSRQVSRLIVSDREIASVEVDPHRESADVDRSNNIFPRKISRSRFQLYKDKQTRNEMQKSGAGTEEDKQETEPDTEDTAAESEENTGSS